LSCFGLRGVSTAATMAIKPVTATIKAKNAYGFILFLFYQFNYLVEDPRPEEQDNNKQNNRIHDLSDGIDGFHYFLRYLVV